MQSIQIPVTQTGLEQSIQQALKNAGRNAQINLGTNSRQINALAQPLGRITGQADEFTKSMEAANARVFAFGASVGVINGVTKAFQALVKNTIATEKALADININLQQSSTALDKFGNDLFNLAKSTGQSFQTVADGALELSRQGLDAVDVVKRLNDVLILSRLSGLDAQQSVEGLTAAINSFSDAGITSAQILNKLVVVSQQYAVSERDLIEGIKRSASVADQAGVSFDELVGIITTVQERTARGGAVIGNAFKTIFSKIQDKGALEDLQNLGIQVTDTAGKILPATTILQNLAVEFEGLSQIQQTDIAKKLGGVYQLSNLLAAVKDLGSEQSKYAKIVKLSESANSQAYQKNAALNQTLDALINKVSISAEQLGATLGKIGLTDNLKGLLSFFNELLDGIQNILGEESGLGNLVRGLAKGIGNLITGPGLALFGAIILKLSKDLVQFGFSSLKSFFGIGKAAKEIADVEKSINTALATNIGLQQKLFSLEGNRAGQLKVITDALIQQEAVIRRSASISKDLSTPSYQLGVRATTQGLRVPEKGAAAGYMPAVAKESFDISKGVGGARSGDKPVVIPNFNFGGGKKGSIVAHTGEYAIPNFAGSGGTAIFNRNMVKKMGLPAGAKKIGAAGGLIPNFAAASRDSFVGLVGLSKGTVQGEWNAFSRDNPDLDLKNKDYAYQDLKDKDDVKEAYLNWRTSQSRSISKTQSKEKSSLARFLEASKDPEFGFIYSGNESVDRNVELDVVDTKGNTIPVPVKLLSVVSEPSDYLYKEVRKNAIATAKAYARNIGIQPDVVDENKFEKVLNQSLNEGALQGVVGTIFEGALQASIGVPPVNAIQNLDIPNKDQMTKLSKSFAKLDPNHKNYKLSSSLSKLYAGDFKNALNSNNLKSLSGKISRAMKSMNAGKLPTAASGYIPNFVSKSREIGSGAEAKFLRLGKKDGIDVGVKKFYKDGPKNAISNEWLISQYINRYLNIPGVYGPKTLSGLDESNRKGSIRKEIISGSLAKAALGRERSSLFGQGTLRSAIKTKGLDLIDLHGSNYIVNNQASEYINALSNYPTDAVGAMSVLKGMASKGGLVSVIDPGFARLTGSPATDVVSKMISHLDAKRKTAANGYVPNFANKYTKKIGEGWESNVYLSDKGKSISKVFKDREERGEGTGEAITNEWKIGKYINEKLGIAGITGPKILSDLYDSVMQGSIKKQFISDPIASKSLGRNANVLGLEYLRKMIRQKSNLDLPDLHGDNFTINTAAKNNFTSLKGKSPKSINDITGNGGKINIIDPGFAEILGNPAERQIDSILEIGEAKFAEKNKKRLEKESVEQAKEKARILEKQKTLGNVFKVENSPYNSMMANFQTEHFRSQAGGAIFTLTTPREMYMEEIRSESSKDKEDLIKHIVELAKARNLPLMAKDHIGKGDKSILKSLNKSGIKVAPASKKKSAADGYVPNFADFSNLNYTKTPEQIENKRIKNAKKRNWKTAQGAVGKIFGAIDKASPTVLIDGVISGDEIQGLNLDYIKTLIENNGAIAQMLLGDKGSNFVIQAKKYGITVQQSAMKKLTSLAAKALNKVQGLAGGFLPNFANPLQAAINREMAAGVPASQIYVDKSPSLKSAANPMGLMVANRRDEPMGGQQGISRAIKEGRNPKTYGAASGFVPNYASVEAGGNSTGISKLLVGLFAFQSAITVLSGFLDQAGESGKKLSETLQKVAGTLLIFGGIAFSGPIKRLKELSDEVRNTVKISKDTRGGIKSGFSQGYRKGLSGEGYEFARPTGSEARRDRLSNRYNLSNSGLSSARVGAITGAVVRGAGAALGSIIGPAALTIGAIKGISELASGFRTYSNSAAKSLGEVAVYANKASESLSDLDRAAIETQSNKSYGYSFDSLIGSLSDMIGASSITSAISGQQTSNTNFQGRNLQLSNVSEDQFKQIRQAYISSYVGANRTKFATSEDAAGVASADFASQISGDFFSELDVEALAGEIKKLSKEAQLMAKENALAKAMEESQVQLKLAEKDTINFKNVLSDTKNRFLALRDKSFTFQNTIDSFKAISEAAIENSYNFSEYEKTIEKLNTSIDSIDASNGVKQLNLISQTQEKLYSKAKTELKGFGEIQTPETKALFENISNKIISGNPIDINKDELKEYSKILGVDVIDFTKEISEEFKLQKKELDNQNIIEKNNLRIETYRSLVAQQTTASIENQNKKLELQQNTFEKVFEYSEKIRSSQNKIADLKFDRSLIGKTETQKLTAQINRTPQLQQRAREESLINFQQDRIQSVQSLQSLIPSTLSAQKQFDLKNEILGASQQIRDKKTLEDVSSASSEIYNKIFKEINDSIQEESKTRQGFIDKLQSTLTGSSDTFANSVIDAAKEFKRIIAETANEPKKQKILTEISQQETELQNRNALLQKFNSSFEKVQSPTATKADFDERNQLQLLVENIAKKENIKLSTEEDFKKYVESASISLDQLKIKLNEFNNSVEVPIQSNFDDFLPLGNQKQKIPKMLERLLFSESAPLPQNLPTQEVIQNQSFEAAKKDLEASILEISNVTENQVYDYEKLTNISTILADKFNVLKSSIPSNIAELVDARNKSISGEEISRTNYDIETQRQLAGANTKEEADKIIRDRQNKSVGQLFDEKFYRTPEELSLRLNTTLVDASVQFKDNLIDGITQAVESGASLSDILRNAALEFARSMTKAALGNVVDGIGSMFGINRASGGAIVGGSGNKDDVPAMLMGGEFVMNKKAVQKYGPDFLNALNSGSIGGYAKGGPVQKGPQGNFYTPGQYGLGAISGSKNLLDFATQTSTTGKRDEIINSGNFASINLEAESARLTNFGRQNNPAADALRSAKGEAFSLYLRDYEAKKEEQKKQKEQSKALRNQLLTMAITAVAGGVIKAGASGFQNAFKAAEGTGFGNQLWEGAKGIFTGGDIGGSNYGGLKNLFTGKFAESQIGSNRELSSYLRDNPDSDLAKSFYSNSNKMSIAKASYTPQSGGAMSSVSAGRSFANSQSYNEGFDSTDAISYANSLTKGRANDISRIGVNGSSLFREPDLSFDNEGFLFDGSLLPPLKKAIGGMIPSTSGIDTVSTMLSGGEFIMNRAAAQNIGSGNLQALNSGAKSLPTEEKSEELNDRLISKLDELIEASGSAGNITINVEGASGKSSETSDGNGAEGKQQLARQIRDAVLKVIQEEKRLGGQLRRGM